MAKPWYCIRSTRIFRDESDLSAAPEGWPQIEAALANSRYFFFLASREAKESKWVKREIDYWFANYAAAGFPIVPTDGNIVWDKEHADFDWNLTNHYVSVASERGKGRSDPPGAVYLLNLETLRPQELPPGQDARGRRLEYMGFSTSGDQIFIMRQFYPDIYGIEGERTKSVQLDFYAEPIHQIAGMFGSYLLFGDTMGHLMLADTDSAKRRRLTSGHGAAVLIDANKKGTRAIVVFESGMADLVILDDLNTPVQREIANEGVIFATFGQSGRSEQFLTATKSGEVDLWDSDGGTVKRLAHFNHGKTPVRIAGFSKDEQRIISLGDDSTVRLWDASSGRLIASKP